MNKNLVLYIIMCFLVSNFLEECEKRFGKNNNIFIFKYILYIVLLIILYLIW